jgi:3-methyladenine DNA glycosylase Tag
LGDGIDGDGLVREQQQAEDPPADARQSLGLKEDAASFYELLRSLAAHEDPANQGACQSNYVLYV